MMDKIPSTETITAKIEKTTAGKTAASERETKLKKACADFEAMLVYQLLKTMRQTIPKSGFLSGSYGKDTYEMMMDQKIADDVAKKGQGLGLQKMLYNQLAKQPTKKD
jgi:peptidoglycan hydrolase FlgJ